MDCGVTCNLLTTLSYPPWTEDLNRQSYMTRDGQKRIPFHVYVQTGNKNGTSSSAAIPQFERLPQELQLRILAMCCPSTLFQLMHTSASLRIEASKLFWASQDTYFLVKAYWLFKGAYPGCTTSDPTFFPHVQNVEVEYTTGLDSKICPREDEKVFIQHDRIARFWEDIQRTFPRMKRIILNANIRKHPRDGKEPFRLSLQLLLRACPRHIEASALCLEEVSRCLPSGARFARFTWRRVVFTPSAEPGSWEESEPNTARQTVLMPPRRFSGPVGRFMEMEYLGCEKIPYQQHCLWPLIVEAIDRYYLDAGQDTPFACPLPDCNNTFYKAGEWSIHAVKHHWLSWRTILEAAPRSIKSMFEERSQDLDKKLEEVRDRFIEIKNMWEANDGARQSEITRVWMEQLASEPGWETDGVGEQSQVWLDFLWSLYPSE